MATPPVETPAQRTQSLFCSEAVAAHGAPFGGHVHITRPLATRLLTLFILAVTATLLAFVICGEYARKETVAGFLEPEHGVIRVLAPRGGLLSELHVHEGEIVARDTVLFKVRLPQTLGDGSDTARKQLANLAAARAVLADSRTRESARAAATERTLAIQVDSLRQQHTALLSLQHLQQQQVQLGDVQLQRLASLRARRGIPQVQWLSIRSEHLAGREKMQATRARVQATQGELAALQSSLATLRHDAANRSAALDAQGLALERTELDIQASRDFAVRAPVAGLVMTLQRRIGEAVAPAQFVLTIVPQHSPLLGRLLIPTRAIGFVAPGQTVRLRYDAFPYQHFGTQAGVLDAVAGSVLFSGDVYGPLSVGQPAYPATVSIAHQSVDADGRAVPLRAGMLLQADIILERRSILEWLAQPLFALRGRS
jgi:membrane fusion protein